MRFTLVFPTFLCAQAIVVAYPYHRILCWGSSDDSFQFRNYANVTDVLDTVILATHDVSPARIGWVCVCVTARVQKVQRSTLLFCDERVLCLCRFA